MEDIYLKSQEAAEYLNGIFQSQFSLAIITGSGLDVLLEGYQVKARVPFADVPHLPQSTFHKGEFLHCEFNGVEFLALNGRLHYYEGYPIQTVTFPVRILAALGIKNLIVTNASGGLNPDYDYGELVLIRDHINLMPEHPLRGPNDDRLGDRFPDMSDAYSSELRQRIQEIAQAKGIELKEGVYAGFQGPSLETPAEYKFIHIIGADMVGMSTVPEVIVANHCGMEVMAFSIVTNVCYPPERIRETSVEDVIQTANEAAPKLSILINDIILRYPQIEKAFVSLYVLDLIKCPRFPKNSL